MPEKEKTENYNIAKASSIKGSYPVYKPNPLLLARDEMKIMQARFFSAYLCKVNPEDESTYKVRFSFSAFCNLLDLDKRNVKRIRDAANSVLECRFDFADYIRKHGNVALDPMLMKRVNLFEVFELTGNNEDGFFIEVTPTRQMEYLLKKHAEHGYVSYKLQNVINLSTPRNIRLYEFLKRAEGVGVNVDLSTLKAYLGLSDEDYPEWRDFKRDVLEKGLKEINSDKTDIFVSYTERRKGKGGKIVGFKFVVKRKGFEEKEETAFDEEKVELSQEDIDMFNSKSASKEEGAPAPEMVKVTLLNGQEAWVDKSLIYMPNTDPKYNNCFDLYAGLEEELTGKKRSNDKENEAVEIPRVEDNVMKNPLEKAFDSEDEEREYVEEYIDKNFKDETNKMLVDFIPADVHCYDEDKVAGIRNAVVVHVPFHTMPGEKEIWISNTISRYTIREWPKKKNNVKYKAYSYYLDGLERWLAANYE